MLKSNGIDHRVPGQMAAKAIQLALQPRTTTPATSLPVAVSAARADRPASCPGRRPGSRQERNQARDRRRTSPETSRYFPIPPGYTLAPVGFDPEKGQMTDARRFQIEKSPARWRLPPVFLQDLSRATFSNAEQQDLHLVEAPSSASGPRRLRVK